MKVKCVREKSSDIKWHPGRAGPGLQERGGAGGAYSRTCPLLPSARSLREKKRELERCLVDSVRVQGERERERRASCISLSELIKEEQLHGSCFGGCFAVWDPERCQTHDTMSRRKLGSRPQHLSSIQGKSESTLKLELDTNVWGYI